MGFAGAGWAEEDHVLLAGDEVEGGEVGDQVAFQPTSMIKVELFDAFAGREPGGPDPVFAAVGVAGGDLTLQAGRQVFLMAPRFVAGPVGEPARGFAPGGRLQRPRQIGDLGGHIASGFRAGHHVIPPSNPATLSALS
jgi:hypothetical protein